MILLVLHYANQQKRFVSMLEGGGYYHVHGVTTDETLKAADDEYENDL